MAPSENPVFQLKPCTSAAATGAPTGATSFVLSSEHRRFTDFCEACQRYRYIGLCYGVPGGGQDTLYRGGPIFGESTAANCGPAASMSTASTVIRSHRQRTERD